MKLLLFDDGTTTYRALTVFEWPNEIQPTPWGDAAALVTPRPITTARYPHPWFGQPNGRIWNQMQPLHVSKTQSNCAYDLNAQDVVGVDTRFGGGFLSYGRHDRVFGGPRPCLFGHIVVQRYQSCDADYNACLPPQRGVYDVHGPDGHSVIMFEITRGTWSSQYTGNGMFTYDSREVTGTRKQLHIAGMHLRGWSHEHDDQVFRVRVETVSDNLGEFARRTEST